MFDWFEPFLQGENRRENRFSEHQKVLPSLSVSRSAAGVVVRWVTDGSVVTFLKPKYGIFWCRPIASILDPSPFRPNLADDVTADLYLALREWWKESSWKVTRWLSTSVIPRQEDFSRAASWIIHKLWWRQKYTLLFSQLSLLNYLVWLTEFGELHSILWRVLEKVWKEFLWCRLDNTNKRKRKKHYK